MWLYPAEDPSTDVRLEQKLWARVVNPDLIHPLVRSINMLLHLKSSSHRMDQERSDFKVFCRPLF